MEQSKHTRTLSLRKLQSKMVNKQKNQQGDYSHSDPTELLDVIKTNH